MNATPDSDTIPPAVPAPAAFIRAARASLRQTPDGVDPWYHRYLGDLLDDRGLRTWVRAKKQLLDLVGGAEGKVVVDGGSGFGMVSNLLAAWGAKRVWAIELHEPMIRSHMRVNAAHFGEYSGRVVPVRADVARLPLPAASADIVMSIEAISHYYDVDQFLDECRRVLKPGGWVVISDGNGHHVVFFGDVIPTALHLRLPFIMAYDLDVVGTLQSKRKLLERILAERWLAVFGHELVTPAGYLGADDKGNVIVSSAVTLE